MSLKSLCEELDYPLIEPLDRYDPVGNMGEKSKSHGMLAKSHGYKLIVKSREAKDYRHANGNMIHYVKSKGWSLQSGEGRVLATGSTIDSLHKSIHEYTRED